MVISNVMTIHFEINLVFRIDLIIIVVCTYNIHFEMEHGMGAEFIMLPFYTDSTVVVV